MDVPFRYLPDEIFQECCVLLNPRTVRYSWRQLAQKLKVPVEPIRYFISDGVANADRPPAAFVLEWFQYGGFKQKNGILPKNYRERGGTLATFIEKLREFPRYDVIEVLEEPEVLQAMHEEFNKDKDYNNNQRRAPGEGSDPVYGFSRERTANATSKASEDEQGDVDTMNIKLDSANININGTKQVVIHVYGKDAGGFCGSDTSGSGTPSPGDSPPWNGARPKEPTSGFKNGCKCQHVQEGSNRPFKRQDSNTSVSSCEMPLPRTLSARGSFPDADSEASSLDSGEFATLREQLQPSVWKKTCIGCGKQCPSMQSPCRGNIDSVVGFKQPVPLQTQVSKNGSLGTRHRNYSEPSGLRTIDGPILLLCHTTLMKNEASRPILTTVGGEIRKHFKLADGSDPVQFSLWSAERCRYSRDGNIREEIAMSIEKSALIVIFANRWYLKAIAEVERALQNDKNFVPKVEDGRKSNVYYIYHQLQANRLQLDMNKIVTFCKKDQIHFLPSWLRNSHIAAWPGGIDDVMNTLLPLLPQQAKLILRAMSLPSTCP